MLELEKEKNISLASGLPNVRKKVCLGLASWDESDETPAEEEQ